MAGTGGNAFLIKAITDKRKDIADMNIIHAEYNMYHNTIDINYYNGYILRIDCGKAEDGLFTTPNSQRMLDTLAIDDPLEYARLYLNSEMQDWIYAADMEYYNT